MSVNACVYAWPVNEVAVHNYVYQYGCIESFSTLNNYVHAMHYKVMYS